MSTPIWLKFILLLRQATCYPSFMDKLPSEVHAVESRVQIDRKCVTSRGPGTAMEYSVVLVEQLYGKEKAEEVTGPMVGIAFNIVYLSGIRFVHCIVFSSLYC